MRRGHSCQPLISLTPTSFLGSCTLHLLPHDRAERLADRAVDHLEQAVARRQILADPPGGVPRRLAPVELDADLGLRARPVVAKPQRVDGFDLAPDVELV